MLWIVYVYSACCTGWSFMLCVTLALSEFNPFICALRFVIS